MEALTTTTSSVSFPIVSPLKSRNVPLRRHIRFSTSCKNNCDNDGESDIKSEAIGSALVPVNPIISKDEAMGLVLSAVNGSGWTTGSGMEGPALSGSDSGSGAEQVSTFPWSLFTKSPRRRMRVAFTCNVCGQRTTRAINPHAYTDGTVFVQCCGCNIFHKLVDNLNLFHDMKCYVNSSFNPNPSNGANFKYFDLEDDNGDNNFPLM